LLGLGHIAIKCHGSSQGRAVMNGIRVAQKFVDERVLQELQAALTQLDAKVGNVDTDGGNNGWSRVFEKKSPRSRTKESQKSNGGNHD